MVTGIGKRIVYRTKRDLAERALGQALGLLGNNPEKNAEYLIKTIDRITNNEKDAIVRDWFHNWLEEGKPGREFLGRILKNVHPNVRRRYIARMVVSMFFPDMVLMERCKAEHGITPPAVMLISPSMRCNYRCHGCYAASYERKDDMKPEVFDRVLTEAENIGLNFFVILGGEPFIYPELLDTIKKHKNSFFQIYTNGSYIDRDMARRLVELGNVAPQLSVNGPAEYTDPSRGDGAFSQVMTAMDNLREAGCVFGFSSLLTRDNIDVICSEEWIDLLIEKGALYGWLFLYMPVGDNPNMELMPTPEQRNNLRAAIKHYRQTKPILAADFWSDGALTGGCIAGGRLYFHINHRGDVEPCIFCHFSTHNINECSLIEALGSPFFSSIRDNQPFSFNTLRPCPMIDHPQTMWGIIQQHGAKSTHPGAEEMFTTLAPEMKKYADGVEDIMDDVWDNESYHDWAAIWMTKVHRTNPQRIEERRKEYEASRNKIKR
jgi:MoaA/NifB/PqqE/SkfB family radical SAM enzyme